MALLYISDISDDILSNILARLHGKLLGQAKCVSSRWNRLISDPCFMKSRSRRMVLVLSDPFHASDENVPVDDLDHSMIKLYYPYEKVKNRYVRIVGTFNGIVLLVVNDSYVVNKSSRHFTSHMILYNPLTHASKILDDPYSPFNDRRHIYGLGYGATQDDLRIVRFRNCFPPDLYWNTCDIFNLKTGSWSLSEIVLKDTDFKKDVGTFLCGFLYWFASHTKIVALCVRDMLISEIPLPYPYYYTQICLGTLHGYLCMITDPKSCFEFDVWIMKEQGVWLKVCCFTLDRQVNYYFKIRVINIMNDGRLVLVDDLRRRLIVYNTSKHSYKILKTPINVINFMTVLGIEYEESMISPSDICCV